MQVKFIQFHTTKGDEFFACTKNKLHPFKSISRPQREQFRGRNETGMKF